MKNKLNIKYIWKDFIDRIWSVYFYLLSFYILSRFLSLSIKSWQNCNWKFFDIFILICSIITFFNPKVQLFFKKSKKEMNLNKIISEVKFPKLSIPKMDIRSVILFIASSISLIVNLLKKIFCILGSFFWKLCKIGGSTVKRIKWTKSLIFKIVLGITIVVFALSKDIQMLDFWVLIYGLIAVLFIIESRIAAGIALICLMSCPFLLIFKQEIYAEAMAIYAYYFLIITVLTQIREFRKEEKLVPVDNIVANKKRRVIIRTR